MVHKTPAPQRDKIIVHDFLFRNFIPEGKKTFRLFLLVLLVAIPFFLTGCSASAITKSGASFRDWAGERILGLAQKSQKDLKLGLKQKEQIPSKYLLTETQKKLLENWLYQKGLNYYGDPISTFYEYGSPLKKENAGREVADRYEYIVDHHLELINILGLSVSGK